MSDFAVIYSGLKGPLPVTGVIDQLYLDGNKFYVWDGSNFVYKHIRQPALFYAINRERVYLVKDGCVEKVDLEPGLYFDCTTNQFVRLDRCNHLIPICDIDPRGPSFSVTLTENLVTVGSLIPAAFPFTGNVIPLLTPFAIVGPNDYATEGLGPTAGVYTVPRDGIYHVDAHFSAFILTSGEAEGFDIEETALYLNLKINGITAGDFIEADYGRSLQPNNPDLPLSALPVGFGDVTDAYEYTLDISRNLRLRKGDLLSFGSLFNVQLPISVNIPVAEVIVPNSSNWSLNFVRSFP